jgi:hypothetical protein
MPGMKREILIEILKRAPGVEGSKNTYKVAEQHRLTFYLGHETGSIVVSEVHQVTLENDFVELVSKDGTYFAVYEGVRFISDRAPKKETERRPGFS